MGFYPILKCTVISDAKFPFSKWNNFIKIEIVGNLEHYISVCGGSIPVMPLIQQNCHPWMQDFCQANDSCYDPKSISKRGWIASSCHMKSKQISCCLPFLVTITLGRQQLICFDFMWQLLAINPLLLYSLILHEKVFPNHHGPSNYCIWHFYCSFQEMGSWQLQPSMCMTLSPAPWWITTIAKKNPSLMF